MNSKNIKPLPVSLYFFTVLILIIAGIAISTYLLFSHYKVYTDISYKSFCAVSKAINCDTVAQSPYSLSIGVPIAAWGIAGYMLLLGILFFSLDTKGKKMRVLATLILITLIFSCLSLYFGIISGFIIHSYCIMCILIYAINFMLLYMFWLIKRRYETHSFLQSIKTDIKFWKINKTKIILLISSFFIISVALIIFFPHYWEFSPKQNNTAQLNTGYTEQGDPWIGAQNPELVITEFTDYFCFQCKKMHFFLRALVSEYPNKLRLVHKHFPMDHKFNPIVKEPFHQGAGVMSLIAIYAAEQNEFWEINDILFNYQITSETITLQEISEFTHLDINKLANALNNPDFRTKLNKDIIQGLKNNITGTPAYIINNKVYIGQIPSNILRVLNE